MICGPEDNSLPWDVRFGKEIQSSSILEWMEGPNTFLGSRVGRKQQFLCIWSIEQLIHVCENLKYVSRIMLVPIHRLKRRNG
jgi:hypothetical protein